MRAHAVIFPDRLKVEYREVTVPDPGPNDIVVQTRYSWISNGTEGSFLRCERINGEMPYRPGDPWPFPIAPGYQSTGIVMHVGRGITDVRPGQWVFCTIGRIDGMYEPFGGHISPKVVDRSQVWPLPSNISPVAVSGLVLIQVGYNCGTRPQINAGDTALVVGDGLVGHWAAQTLASRGAKVLLAGKHDDRLAFFAHGNADLCINVAREDLVSGVKRIVPAGLNVLIDTVGSLSSVRQCMPLMKHNGHIVSAGFNGTDSLIDVQRLRFGELTFHSPSGWEKRRMDETLALITGGHLRTEDLITHRFPAARADDAWKLILDRTETVLGVVLEWG